MSIIVFLACSWWAVDGLRSSTPLEQYQSSPHKVSALEPLKSLALSLLAFNPAAPFNPAAASPLSYRRTDSKSTRHGYAQMCNVVPSAGVQELEEEEQHMAKVGPKISRPIQASKIKAYQDAALLNETRPCIILCRPFEDGNVGATARAMLNFGLTQLRLVRGNADPESDVALLRAAGAAPVLQDAVTHESLAAAVADLNLVIATTARQRSDRRIPVYTPRESVQLASSAIRRGERVGFLFGSETNGLNNEDLNHAHGIVTISTIPGFYSLNLAQAVLLMAYEWSSENIEAATDESHDSTESASGTKQLPGSARRQVSEFESAPLGQLDSFFEWWESVLWKVEYFGSTGKDTEYSPEERSKQDKLRASEKMAKLRRLVLKSNPDKGEVSLLRGVLSKMFKGPYQKNHTQTNS